MKKFFILCAVALCSVLGYADIRTLQQGLTLERNGDMYIIHFSMPDYEIVDKIITDINGEHLYSCLQPYNDYFDYLDEDGRPSLPFYSVFLAWPLSGMWSVHVQTYTTTISLDNDYVPAQSMPRPIVTQSYDASYYNYYNDHWYWDDYQIHRGGFGLNQGIYFSFYPCHYEPFHRELTIVTEATYEIDCSNSLLAAYFMELFLQSDISFRNIYDNFGNNSPESLFLGSFDDEYLIISSDQFHYEDTLQSFIDYKEHLGYCIENVKVGDLGSTPDGIRDYIKDAYEDRGLKYVLIVGDVSEIPFSSGTALDDDDPPTDIYYACLDSNTIADQAGDISPDVYVGRWPVTSLASLEHTIAKTIKSENELWNYHPDRVAIFTGSGNGADFVYEDGEFLYDSIVMSNLNYYTGTLYDGRGYADRNMLIGELEHKDLDIDPTWLFIYTGHGNSEQLGLPYGISYYDIESIICTSSLPYQSFGFAFACYLGNLYSTNSFVRSWMGSINGGPTFCASTTHSFFEPDRHLSRTMFNQIKSGPSMTLGEFVANGVAKYYNACPTPERFNEAKRYVFYGDPSLYLCGVNVDAIITMMQNLPDPKRIKNDNLLQQQNNQLVINPEMFEGIQHVYLYSITGQLIRSGVTDILDIQNIPAGIYTIVIQDSNRKYSYPFVIK